MRAPLPDLARLPPPRLRTPLIKSPDSVKKDCMGGEEGGASEGGCRRRFSISLYTAFQMMTEIKHILRCRRSFRCVCRDCGELFLFGPILDQLTTTILATFSRRRPPSLTHSFVRVNHGTSFLGEWDGWEDGLAAAGHYTATAPATASQAIQAIHSPLISVSVENYPSFLASSPSNPTG